MNKYFNNLDFKGKKLNGFKDLYKQKTSAFTFHIKDSFVCLNRKFNLHIFGNNSFLSNMK